MHNQRFMPLVVMLGLLVTWSASCTSATQPAHESRAAGDTPAALATARPTSPPTPAPPAVVKVSYTQGLGTTFQIALARGYFQELGIDIERVEFRSSAEAIIPLGTGEIDAGSATPNAGFFNALARGVRINLAIDASHVDPNGRFFPLVARATAEGPAVSAPAELRGKRVAQNQRGFINEWALDRVLSDVGLQLDDVDITVMPFPDVLAAFGGGTMDASVLPEPFGTLAEERGLGVRILDTDRYIPGGQVSAMAFSEAFAHNRLDVARRWSVAYLRGAREFMDALEFGRDREAIVAILAQAVGIEPRLLDRAGWAPVRRDGRVNVAALEAILDWLVQRGYVAQRPDLSGLLDPQFAEYAQRTLDAAN